MIETERPTAIMNPALRDFWLKQSRFKILYGGRASGKSWDTAAHSVRVSNAVKVRVLCTRMFQNKIEESVYTTIKTQIERFDLQKDFRILNNKIISKKTGSEYLFYGLARNIDEIKSLEGIDILWIEEAHNLTAEMWEILEPTIRKEASEIWIIFNPRLATDFAYQRFVIDPPKNSILRFINYDENEFLSQTMIETINELKEKNYEEYLHIYGGKPRADDEAVIIKRAWIDSAIDAHKKLNVEVSGKHFVGFDPADAGEDKNAACTRHGILVSQTEEWHGGEHQMFQSCERVFSLAAKKESTIIYDSIGVGAGCGSNFSKINKAQKKNLKYIPFNAQSKVRKPNAFYEHGVRNKDHFSNLKAQSWWLVADRFKETYNAIIHGKPFDPAEIISISSDCDNLEKLISELSTPKRDYDGSGRVKVESKKSLSDRGVKSPNLADSFIACFAPVKKRELTIGSA